ncbi:MAG: DNA-3-methyladenine glycosylase I [Planctomycetes bacterium]|nr:DNA-3-methyladenine glycosylase I [Planctomycetota bacterium]NOG55376.1 DNA-3-methyladenine glycosylase I [Planctomycetota bacterium]
MARRKTDTTRCAWAKQPEMIEYHDTEWGVPVHGDDHRLFEKITLEGAQAGLSWLTILRKREGYRKAFADFDPAKVARFTPAKVEKLLQNPEIIRNRLKVESTVNNAKAVLRVQKEFGSLDEFVWGLVGNKTTVNRFRTLSELPAKTDVSTVMSKALLKQGFRFVGPTICYAFMQGIGMVNDHVTTCFRHKEVQRV